MYLGATEGSAGPPAFTRGPLGIPLNTPLDVLASTAALLSVPNPQPVLRGLFAYWNLGHWNGQGGLCNHGLLLLLRNRSFKFNLQKRASEQVSESKKGMLEHLVLLPGCLRWLWKWDKYIPRWMLALSKPFSAFPLSWYFWSALGLTGCGEGLGECSCGKPGGFKNSRHLVSSRNDSDAPEPLN